MNAPASRRHQGRTIELQVDLHAPPGDVYAAWAEPDAISRWFVDRMEGEARAGGVIWWVFEHFRLRHPIPVVAAEPGRELVFGGELPGRPPFLQEFLCKPYDGGTRLTLRNSGFGDGPEWDDEFAAVHSGWVLALATLKRWIETDRDSARAHLQQMRPAVFEFESVQPFFTTAAGLSQWLAQRAVLPDEPLQVGTDVQLDLGEDLVLNGQVLARTEREVLLDWPEEHAVLALKCFTMYGDQRAVCLDLNAWPLAPGRRTLLESWMTRSLNRLGECLAPTRS